MGEDFADLAGYSVRDLLIRPVIREYYSTSTYVGVAAQAWQPVDGGGSGRILAFVARAQ